MLDEPVLVETAGTLWVAYDDANDSGSGAGACLAGCGEGGDGGYQWLDGQGWDDGGGEGVPLFTVTVEHD